MRSTATIIRVRAIGRIGHVVALVFLLSASRSARAAVADIAIDANDSTTSNQVREMLQQIEADHSTLFRRTTQVKLLKKYEATALNHGAGTPTKIEGSFATQCLVGAGVGTLISGADDHWTPDNYLILCRIQELDDVDEPLACRFDIRATRGPSFWSTSVSNRVAAKGQWHVISLRILPSTRAMDGVDYQLLPMGHSVAIDEIFILRLVSSPSPTVTPSPTVSPNPSPRPSPVLPPRVLPTVDNATRSYPVDIPVTSAPPDPNPTTAPSTSDPDEIERPQYQNSAKPLLKSVTSITSMMVNIADDGEAHGITSDIIAIVPPESRRLNKSGIGFARTDGDDMMKTALDEALRAVTLRYPIWAPGHIDLSFGEKFVSHGGPSAGTAFGVLMLSVLEGFSIDPKCAVTGDISVDWKVRKVGGVSAKLHGATLDKCLYATIPEDNEVAFEDMGCLYGHSALWGIQVFSIETLQDAVAIARKDRAPQLQQAMNLFAELQPQLTRNEATALRSPRTIEMLNKILELAPNHLSAKCVLALSDGTASRLLSENGTLHQLSVIFYPYRTILENRQNLNRTTLPPYVTTLARKRLNALRPIASRDLLPLVNDVAALISTMDDFAEGNASPEAVITHAEAVDGRFAALDSAPDFAERLVREGY